jgi:hypothetical protein
MTEIPETPEEKLQSILGDLTSEEFQDIIKQEINEEVIRVLYEDPNRNYLFPMIKEDVGQNETL